MPGGYCDRNNDCNCNQENLEKYVCGAGDLDKKTSGGLCNGWCQYKGKQSGN